MKRLLLVLFVLPLLFACGDNEETNSTVTLTVNVKSKIELTGKFIVDTDAVVYLFENIELWGDNPLNPNYKYVADGKIEDIKTGRIVNYSQKQKAKYLGAKFTRLSKGYHSIMVKCGLYEKYSLMKVNGYKDNVIEVSFEND